MKKVTVTLSVVCSIAIMFWCIFCLGYYTAFKQSAVSLEKNYACKEQNVDLVSLKLATNQVNKAKEILRQEKELSSYLRKNTNDLALNINYWSFILHPKNSIQMFLYDDPNDFNCLEN